MKLCTIDSIPHDITRVLVLGARISEPHKLSPILKLRMYIVSLIAHKREDIIFHLSGCYEDTTLMYQTLVEQYHLDENRFIIDFLGYCTWDSIANMTTKYGNRHFIILTSSFHINRAMVIAKWMKSDAVAFDVSKYEMNKKSCYATREKVAYLKAALLMLMDASGIHFILKHIINSIYQIIKWVKLNLFIRPTLPLDIKFTEHILNSFHGDITDSNTILYLAEKLNKSNFTYLSHLSDEEMLVRPRYVDCTTFIEYILSFQFLISKGLNTFDAFCDSVRKIRYKDGIIGFVMRNHYFSWTIDSMIKDGLVKEIDVSSFGAHQIIHLSFMTDHPYLFRQFKSHPEWIQKIKEREQEYEGREYSYIPIESLNKPKTSDLGIIKNGDILCVIVNSHSWARGLDIKHLLIAKWKDDRLYFMHCSQNSPLESKVDLYTYLKDKYTMAGIRVLRPVISDN